MRLVRGAPVRLVRGAPVRLVRGGGRVVRYGGISSGSEGARRHGSGRAEGGRPGGRARVRVRVLGVANTNPHLIPKPNPNAYPYPNPNPKREDDLAAQMVRRAR